MHNDTESHTPPDFPIASAHLISPQNAPVPTANVLLPERLELVEKKLHLFISSFWNTR